MNSQCVTIFSHSYSIYMVSLATSPIIKCDIPNQRQQLLSTDLIDLLVVHHTMFHQDLAKGKLSICGFIFPRAVACLPENTIITMRNHISCNITEKWLADLKSAPMITPKSIKTWKWKIFTIFFFIFYTKPEIARNCLLIPYYSNTINFVVRENEISIRYSAFTEWKKFFRRVLKVSVAAVSGS